MGWTRIDKHSMIMILDLIMMETKRARGLVLVAYYFIFSFNLILHVKVLRKVVFDRRDYGLDEFQEQDQVHEYV